MDPHGRRVRWVARNLAVQGFALSLSDARRLGVALRFSPGVSLTVLILGLALRSVPLVLALASLSAVGGLGARHPLDRVWDYAITGALRAPGLPPNPPRRRRAWRIAGVWLLMVGALLAAGATIVAVALGVIQVVAFATATSFNLCIPSELQAHRERRQRRTREHQLRQLKTTTT
jgi:hypothetical protein